MNFILFIIHSSVLNKKYHFFISSQSYSKTYILSNREILELLCFHYHFLVFLQYLKLISCSCKIQVDDTWIYAMNAIKYQRLLTLGTGPNEHITIIIMNIYKYCSLQVSSLKISFILYDNIFPRFVIISNTCGFDAICVTSEIVYIVELNYIYDFFCIYQNLYITRVFMFTRDATLVIC